ncbi:hypothetical protein Nepgr_002703 [Nepenthes gracilis]|uniref:Uncharacterized protein n=1 Tax=Nepenthes gracilis TaxID=150966 RepID=A0AAD3P9Y4_NEPGR|nr:hypothetical protein Nepgr_002703 [Nepenthes gracilis]
MQYATQAPFCDVPLDDTAPECCCKDVLGRSPWSMLVARASSSAAYVSDSGTVVFRLLLVEALLKLNGCRSCDPEEGVPDRLIWQGYRPILL